MITEVSIQPHDAAQTGSRLSLKGEESMFDTVTENPAETFRTAIEDHEEAPRRRYNEAAAQRVLLGARALISNAEAVAVRRRISDRLVSDSLKKAV